MNAMPAVTRPGDPGIRPYRGGVARSARRPDRDLARRPDRDLARRPDRDLARRPHRAASSGDAPRAALRLTRRGRVVAAAVAALLVTVVSLLAAGAAQATNHALPSGAARQNLIQVVVHPGQSLWSVAESADPDQDTRAVIQQIVDLNSLSGGVVFAGQRLWVPRG